MKVNWYIIAGVALAGGAAWWLLSDGELSAEDKRRRAAEFKAANKTAGQMLYQNVTGVEGREIAPQTAQEQGVKEILRVYRHDSYMDRLTDAEVRALESRVAERMTSAGKTTPAEILNAWAEEILGARASSGAERGRPA